MKKALATLIALALPAAALAEGASGFYVQADAAHAKASSSLGSAKGFSPRISAGYRINDLRFAVDYTRYKNYKAPSTDFKLYSIGASAIYDFDTQSPVKPYLGALEPQPRLRRLGRQRQLQPNLHRPRRIDGRKLCRYPECRFGCRLPLQLHRQSQHCQKRPFRRTVRRRARQILICALFCKPPSLRRFCFLPPQLHKPAVLYDNPECCGFCRPIF